MVGAGNLQMDTYEEYFRSQIKSSDQIVFYFHGDIYFYLLSSVQLSIQQLTKSVDFTIPFLKQFLRHFNPSNVIISQVTNIFLDKIHPANNSIEKLFWITQTLAIFFDTENSYRRLVMNCNETKRKVEFCQFYELVVQTPSLKFVLSFSNKKNKEMMILCNTYCLDSNLVFVQLRFSTNKILDIHKK